MWAPTLVLVAVSLTAAPAVLAVLVALPLRRVAPMPARPLPLVGVPPLSMITARDGTRLAHRFYEGDQPASRQVAVLIHGSATSSLVMHPLALELRTVSSAVYALDIRGHGASGKRGDLAYAGQIDDDVADVLAEIRGAHPGAAVTMIGFSAGGAFALRFAAGKHADRVDRFILLAPAFVYPSRVARPGSGGWAAPHRARILGLLILNLLGVRRFDHLPVIAFGVAPDDDRWAEHYSWRLASSFGIRDPKAAAQRAGAPMVLLAGEADDQFYADRYADELRPGTPDLDVRLLPELGHVDLILDPRGIDAIVAAFAGPESPDRGSGDMRLGVDPSPDPEPAPSRP